MNHTAPNPPRGRPWRWVAGGLLIALIFAVLIRQSTGARTVGQPVLDFLFVQLANLRHAQDAHPAAVYGTAFVLYVAVTGLSLPGAAILSLAYGWMFGFWPGLILVSVSSTTGATMAFLTSRYLLRHLIQQWFGERLARLNAAFEREGAYYLFTLRLIPLFPFFVVNAGMGLTPISIGTFWWVSQVGMLPATAIYVYAGTQLPGLEELQNPSATKLVSPQLLVALTLLGLFPLVMKKIMSRFAKPTGNTPDAASP